jgi:hypothetical protein
MACKSKKKKLSKGGRLDNPILSLIGRGTVLQLGGGIPPYVEEERQWLLNYMQSPKYKERLEKDPTINLDALGVTADEYIQDRIYSITNMPIEQTTFDDGTKAGYNFTYDKPSNTTTEKILMGNSVKPYEMLHEFGHASRYGLAQKSAEMNNIKTGSNKSIDIQNKYRNNEINQLFYTPEELEYRTNIDENVARIQGARKILYDNYGIEPTSDYTEEDLDKLYEYKKNNEDNNLVPLMEGVDREDILWMLNNLAYQNKNNEHKIIAAMGGKINKKNMASGGWLKENQQGVLGGLTTAAGIGLMATGVGGPLGAGLIGQGVGMMGSQVATNQEQQLQQQQLNALKQQQQLEAIQSKYSTGMFQLGGNLTEFNGPKHQNGGIPLGQNVEVEGGESRGIGDTKDYVFSDTLKTDDKKTFSDIAKKIEKKYGDVSNDIFALESKNLELANLMAKQEGIKMDMFKKEVTELAEQYPNEFQALMQQQSAQQQQATQQQGQQQMSPEQQQMMMQQQMAQQQGQQQASPEQMAMMQQGQQMQLGGRIKLLNGGPDGIIPPWYDSTKAKQHTTTGEFNAANYTDIYNDNGTMYGLANQNLNKVIPAAVPVSQQGTFTDAQKLQIMQNEYLSGKEVRYGWGEPIHNQFNQWVATQEGSKQGIYNPNTPIVDTPVTSETVPPDPTITYEDQYTNTEVDKFTPEYSPNNLHMGKPDWLAYGVSALPNTLQGLGNAFLATKVNYDRVNPVIYNPTLVDPTRAINNVNTQYNTLKNVSKNASTGAGNYMANLIGITGGQSGDIADIASQYDNLNADIKNVAKQTNMAAVNTARGLNAEIQMQELGDKIGLAQNAMSNVASGLNTGIANYFTDKRDKEKMAIAGGENFYYRYTGPSWKQKLVKVFEGNGYHYYNDETGKTIYLDPNTNKPISKTDAEKLGTDNTNISQSTATNNPGLNKLTTMSKSNTKEEQLAQNGYYQEDNKYYDKNGKQLTAKEAKKLYDKINK